MEAADRAGVVAPSVTVAPGKAAGSRELAKRQWERFAGAVTGWTGGEPSSSTDAYLAAYPKSRRASARANAARLLARPEVAARVRWLRSQLVETVLADAAALRRQLLNDRLKIVEKTKATSHKALALEAMRDIERSLGLDVPEVERETVTEHGEVARRISGNIEDALARALVSRRERTVRRG